MQYLAMMVVAHAGYSLMRWRKFLVAENQFSSFYVPSDIMVQLIVGTILCILAVLARVRRFKPIRDLSCTYTYDSIFQQPNFETGNIIRSRAPALLTSLNLKLENLQLK